MSTRNHFEFYRQRIDYHKYQDKINKFINQIVHEFTKAYKGIANYRIPTVFWELVDNKIKFDPGNWYHVFANLMGKLTAIEILFEEKKFARFHKDAHNEWVGYLADLIIPYEPKIPNRFFIELIQNMPVPEYETVLELYEEGIIMFNENLKEIFFDISIPPSEKILKFKSHFINLFDIFLAKCVFADQELSKHGETAHKNSLYEIFQLNNSNKRTPPNLLRDILIILNHIRNAISHSSSAGIIFIEGIGLKIRDFRSSGELTFERIFTFEELYDYYYMLLILVMEFELMAIMLSLHRVIRELNFKYNKMFKCSSCGHEQVVFAFPGRVDVVCDECKLRYRIIKNTEN